MYQFDPTSVVTRSTPVESENAAGAHGTAIIVSTRGRPDIVASLVKQLGEQTKPPAHVFIIATKADDIAGLDISQKNLTVRIGRPGSTFQRNDGLALAGSQFSHCLLYTSPSPRD